MALRQDFKDWQLNNGISRTYRISNADTGAVFNATITETTDEKTAYAVKGDTFSAEIFNATNAQVNKNTLNQRSVTLSAAGWANNKQSVSVIGVTADNNIFVSPDPASFAAYGDAGIYCSAQATDVLTFTCSDVPSENITVNVIVAG